MGKARRQWRPVLLAHQIGNNPTGATGVAQRTTDDARAYENERNGGGGANATLHTELDVLANAGQPVRHAQARVQLNVLEQRSAARKYHIRHTKQHQLGAGPGGRTPKEGGNCTETTKFPTQIGHGPVDSVRGAIARLGRDRRGGSDAGAVLEGGQQVHRGPVAGPERAAGRGRTVG
uniref:(northern house mosquito) hypothetical protein n=2 Tax=Culex pipiens TaxID=7175 RepID=A0A8D8BHF5_CULPI